MIHKLTALILALLTGSPICWCGWMHDAHHAEVPSCCPQQAHRDQQPTPESQDCPCSKAPKVREVATTKVVVPALTPIGNALPIPEWAKTLQTRWQQLATTAWQEAHGPWRPSVPLYVRHCSLLI